MAPPPGDSLTAATLSEPFPVLVRPDHRVRGAWVSLALATWASTAVVGIASAVLLAWALKTPERP